MSKLATSCDMIRLIVFSLLLCGQCAPVILAPHWTPAALHQVTATVDPITVEQHVTSVPLVTMVTQAAHVSRCT